MNKKLFAEIVRKRTGKADVNNELVRVLGINKNTASERVAGRRPFRADEIEKIRLEYGLTEQEVVECFIKEGD